MVDSKDQIVSLQADLKNKGRNFNRMLHKERIMAMFDLMFNPKILDKYKNKFFEIIKKSGRLEPGDISELQTMGFLFDSEKINTMIASIRQNCGKDLNNTFITRAFFVEILKVTKEQMKEYDVTRNADMASLDTTINTLGDDTAILSDLKTFRTAANTIYEQWYAEEAGINQSTFAQEKSMHVRVNYFVREGMDVPEPLKQEFVDYITARNPAANIKKVSDINWAKVKIDKQITAPIVSVRQINNATKPTTLVRATDIGVTQDQLYQVLNSKDALIRLEGNPCNEKLNPFIYMNWKDGSGKNWTICGVRGKEDGLLHFRKCRIKADGTKDIENNVALTKNDVATEIDFFNKKTSIQDAIRQSFSKFAYFDNEIDLKNEAERGQEIDLPKATPNAIEKVITPEEPTAQNGEPGDNSGLQYEPGFMATNQLFLEDAAPEMVQVNTQSTMSPAEQTINNDTTKNGPSSLPGEPILNTSPDKDITIPPLNDLPPLERAGMNISKTAFLDTTRDTTGSAATRKGEPEENLTSIKKSHTDPGDSAMAIKVGEPSIPAPKISPEMGSITMAGDALEQKPKESTNFSYNLILRDSDFRVLMMSRATALTKGNGISAVSVTDRDAWIEKALNSSEFPEKDKTEIKEMKDKVDDLRSNLTEKGDSSDLQKSLVNAENKLSEAVQFFIFDQKLVGNTFIETKNGTRTEYKPCESIYAREKDNTVIYSEKNDKGQRILPSMRPDKSEQKTISDQKTAYHEYEILKAFSDDVSEMYGKSLEKFRNPSNEQKAFYLADACIKTYQSYVEQNAFQDKNTAIEKSIRANVARKGYDMVSQLNEKTAQHFAVTQDSVKTLKANLKNIDPREQHALPSTRSTSPERQAVTDMKNDLTNKVNDPKKTPPGPANKF